VFPTRFRCTAHGLSAAAGKLGSILGQIVLAKAKYRGVGITDPHSKVLGVVLIFFILPMAVGAIVTKYLVPKPTRDGKPLTLEQLAE
jgi:MFS transporter, PHS family, inorganic phosphate transporter